MPAVYRAGSQPTITVPAPVDAAGAVIPTTGVDYAIFNEKREEVKARAPLTGYSTGGAEINVKVEYTYNLLDADVTRALRRIEVYFGVEFGDERVISSTYVVQAADVLSLMVNSFQTLDEAELTAMDLPALLGWSAATDQDKLGAMASAYDNMCRLSFKYLTEADIQALDVTTDVDRYGRPYYYVPSMRTAGVDAWNDFTANFQRALRRAQVVEADILLAGDPVGDKRRQGIITETIGESKIFLSPKPALQFPVSRACLDQLQGFIYRSARIARA